MAAYSEGQRGIMGSVRRWTNAPATAVMVAAALFTCGEVRAQSSGGNPLGFLDSLFGTSRSKTGEGAPSNATPGTSAPTQAAPGGGGAPPPWSGEDGASGHPLMTASAIREA